jgi:two-component system sensor histidine kinase SenX3
VNTGRLGLAARSISVVSESAAWAVLGSAAALALGIALGLALARRQASVAAADPAPGPIAVAPVPVQMDLPVQIVEVLRHGVVVVDRDERVLIANPAANAMSVTARDRLAISGLSTLARLATDTGASVQDDVDLPSGRPGVLSATAVPLAGADGRVAVVVLLLEDVTEQHRLDAVRRDFVANVSHELKTPVGALTLLAEAITEAADDPEAVQRFAGRMQHEGTRLGRLVRELIELSRLQGAEPLPGARVVPIEPVLEEAADRNRLGAAQSGIAVRVTCPDDLAVTGSENQLTLAISNLIDNAVAYSPIGTRVAVSARAVDDEDGCWAEISVSDQGIGIAEADQVRVFERFYRVDPARSRATGGTGLGLAIVKHVATNHGGAVTVWSSAGSGSTFTIRLPRVHPTTAPSESATTHPNVSAKGTA